ncbi:MAG: hypothetical protein GY870_21515, partial [archaeon]|nr:hypothetical protein [archaeon]
IEEMRETWENETLRFNDLYYNKTRDDEFSGQYDFSSNNDGYSWYAHGKFINYNSNNTGEYYSEASYGNDGILISFISTSDYIEERNTGVRKIKNNIEIRRVFFLFFMIIGTGITIGFVTLGIIGTVIIRKKKKVEELLN